MGTIQRPTQWYAVCFLRGYSGLGVKLLNTFRVVRMNGALPTPCHKLSWRRQEQLNFNFCFFVFRLFYFILLLLCFARISEFSFFIFCFVQFTNPYLCFPHLDCIHRRQMHLAVLCQLHLSQFQFLSSVPYTLKRFVRRPNSLFAGRWQTFLPKRWYPCARIHAVTFEITTVFTVTKLRASNFSYQLSIEITVSVKQLHLLFHCKTHTHTHSSIYVFKCDTALITGDI